MFLGSQLKGVAIATTIVAVVVFIGCSEVDNQVEDIPMRVGTVVVPEFDCNYKKDLAPIKIEVNLAEDVYPTTQYLFLYMKQVSGSNPNWDWCSGAFPIHLSEGLMQTKYINPPWNIPVPGVYSVTTGITKNADDANICNFDNAVPKQHDFYPTGGINCQEYVKIQYDYQQTYDISYGDALKRRLETVFGSAPALDKILFDTDEENLAKETIGNLRQLAVYEATHWGSAFWAQTPPLDLHLLAIEDVVREDFYGENRDLGPSVAGLAFLYSDENAPLGVRGCTACLFVKYIRTAFSATDHREVMLRLATHELGHARANLTHTDSQSPYIHDANYYCVMEFQQPKDDLGHIYQQRYFDFCVPCREQIMWITWP